MIITIPYLQYVTLMLTQLKQYSIKIKFSLKGSRGYKRQEGSPKKGKKEIKHAKEVKR